MQKLRFKQALFFILAFYFGVPVFFITVNLLTDPYNRYRLITSERNLKELLSADAKFLTVASNYDDRLFIKRVIQIAPRQDTVILGGSRIMIVDADAFEARAGKVLNAGVTGATVRDYAAIWQHFKNQNKIPSQILLCLEPQSVYSNENPEGGWNALAGLFVEFMDGDLDFRAVSKIYRKKIVQHLESLHSSETLKASWKVLERGKTKSGLVTYEAAPADLPLRTSALALLPPKQEQKTQEYVDHWGKENGNGESYTLSDWGRFSPQTFRELSRLMNDMRLHGVQLKVLLMPSHPLSFETVRENPEAFHNLNRFVRQVRNLAQIAGAGFYDGLLEYHGRVKNTEFSDGVHLKQAPLYRVLQAMDQELQLDLIKP
jgi:hypothetical protein